MLRYDENSVDCPELNLDLIGDEYSSEHRRLRGYKPKGSRFSTVASWYNIALYARMRLIYKGKPIRKNELDLVEKDIKRTEDARTC